MCKRDMDVFRRRRDESEYSRRFSVWHIAAVVIGAGSLITVSISSAEVGFETAVDLLVEGSFEEAATGFHQLLIEDPENTEAAYNLGLCLLNTGQVDSAAMVLEQVVTSEDLSRELRRDALYNLGLAKAHVAQAIAGMQPGDAKTLFANAVGHFRDALAYSEDDPRFRADTGYNIEAAWRLIEQLEQQMQQQSSSSGSDSLAQEVQDLTEDQDQLRDQTQKNSNPEELADQQQELSERASQLSEEMEKRGMDQPAENMQRAQEAQERAAEELVNQDTQGATESQDEAIEELREALAQLLQQTEEGEEGQEEQAASDAKQAAEELARLRREAEKEKERREEDLQRRGYREPVTERIEVEKNW